VLRHVQGHNREGCARETIARFVHAVTLYEAAAQVLAADRSNEWVTGIAQGLNVVKVSVADVRVEHEVKLGDFTQ
jgi:hypothetical protein